VERAWWSRALLSCRHREDPHTTTLHQQHAYQDVRNGHCGPIGERIGVPWPWPLALGAGCDLDRLSRTVTVTVACV